MHSWSKTEDFIRESLLKQNKTYAVIADEMNTIFGTDKFTRNSVRNRCRRTLTTSEVVNVLEELNFEERWNKFNELMGFKEEAILNKDWPIIKGSFAVFSDVHCPIYNQTAIAEAVTYAKELGVRDCIVAGDFLDTGSFSPHFQYSETNPIEELKCAKELALYLDQTFDNVVYILGNHELWYNKAKTKLPKEFQFLLKDYLIEYVIMDLPHSHFIKEFFTQIGDCVIGHPSMFRAKRMTDVLVSYNYFNSWKSRLGLQDIGCYVHAHTHKLGSLIVEDNGRKVKLFEGGCFCRPAEHISLGHTVSYQPPTEGFIIINQDKYGSTIFNESREYVL